MTAARTETEIRDRRNALDKIERLLRRTESDARLLDGRDYKHRRYAEAYRLLAMLRDLEEQALEEQTR